MKEKTDPPTPESDLTGKTAAVRQKPEKATRAERLAAELRQNLKRRKSQARQRTKGEAGSDDGGN